MTDTEDFATCGEHDPILYVHDAQGGDVAFEEDEGPELCADLTATNIWSRQVPAGDYFVHARSERNNEVIPHYMLLLTILSECGNGVKEQYEQCDGTPGCAANCTIIALCGNNDIETGEQCDDGNVLDGDGCTASCLITADHRCLGEPSVCNRVETVCNNSLDDDGDGKTDGSDSDCGITSVVPGCEPGQRQVVLTARDTPRNLADFSLTTSRLLVPPGLGQAQRVALRLNVLHPRPGQLDLFLRAPSGAAVELATDNGLFGMGYVGTALDDECIISITEDAPPFTGCFSPEGSLATLAGEALEGTWQLELGDDEIAEVGSLASWTLMVCTD